MNMFKLRHVFSLFRWTAKTAQPDVEELVDPRVQAYLDYLRDHGREMDDEPRREEDTVLSLPWAA